MNIPLLRAFQAQPDSYLWPESLARSLQIPLAAVFRDLRALEACGFIFDQEPHRGIRLAEPAQRLCVDQIEWQLSTRVIGRRIAVWQRTTSTNDLAARAARSRSNNGLVVLAEEQTAGRGRLHRRWHAPPRSAILMSTLLFPPAAVRDPALLTSLAAVAVAEVICETIGQPARIKWPNDVRVLGHKICGILVEDLASKRSHPAIRTDHRTGPDPPDGATVRNDSTAWRAVVIGIGINVNMEQDEFPKTLRAPATSLKHLCGRMIDRSELARLIIQRLDQFYDLALAGRVARIGKRWRQLADLVGRPVTIRHGGGVAHGYLEDLVPTEQCTLRLPSGKLLHIAASQLFSIAESE